MIVLKIFLLTLFIVGVWGGCLVPQKSFNIEKYMGPWSIHSFMVPEGAEPPLRCIKIDFAPKGTNQFHANLTGFLLGDGSFYTDDGPMTLDNPDEPSRISINWRGQNFFMTVIESDYDTYAAVNGCAEDQGGNVASYSAIFSRKPGLPDDTVQKLMTILSDAGVDTAQLVKVDNSNC